MEHNIRSVWTLIAVTVVVSVSIAQARAAEGAVPDVHIVQLPEGALVPDVAMDESGILHMVYGLGDNAWYVRSANNGRTFSPPVRVNTEGKVTLKMGERGPKLTLGKDGSIHVVWADQWSPGVKVYPRYSRSLDGAGRSSRLGLWRRCSASMG